MQTPRGLGRTPFPLARRAGTHQQGKQQKGSRPDPRLLHRVPARLDENRIGQQGCQRARVGQGVQAPWRAVRIDAGIPHLHQRTGGGKHKVRQSHRGQQQHQNVPGRVLRTQRLQRATRDDRQQQRRQHQQSHMHPGLRGRLAPGQQVRIAVAAEEHHLEKQHARRPHSGTAAKPRQNELADHGLHLEEQKRT